MIEKQKSSGLDEGAKSILKKDGNAPYATKIIDFKRKLDAREFLPYNKTMEELIRISSSVSIALPEGQPNPLEAYAGLFDEIQGYRDRATEIQMMAVADHTFVEKRFETLFKIWKRYSDAKSQDKRDAEAEEILFFCMKYREDAHNLLEQATSVVYNLNRKHDALKEKIRVLIQAYRITGDGDTFIDSAISKTKNKETRDNIKTNSNSEKDTESSSIEWDEI